MVASRKGGARTPNPTPEEIAKRAAEIRRRWTPATRRRRRNHDTDLIPWCVPECAEDESILDNVDDLRD